MKTCFSHGSNPAVTAYAHHLIVHGEAPQFIAASWQALSRLTLKQVKEYRVIYAKELDKLGVATFTKV